MVGLESLTARKVRARLLRRSLSQAVRRAAETPRSQVMDVTVESADYTHLLEVQERDFKLFLFHNTAESLLNLCVPTESRRQGAAR